MVYKWHSKSKRLNEIKNKINETISTSDIKFLRLFCKKHWYFALYQALDFDRLSLTNKVK